MKRRAKSCPNCKYYATSPIDWPCRGCIPANHEDNPDLRTMFEPKKEEPRELHKLETRVRPEA